MKKLITSFDISNDTDKPLTIIHEPECFEFKLPVNEFVTIEVNSGGSSVLLRHFINNGKIEIAIVTDGSVYSVKQNGLDVFGKYLDE